MTAAPKGGRLFSLSQYEILDTPPEMAFDDIARLAAQLCQAPIALVSLRDHDRHWFKARVGFELSSLPDDISFCAYIPPQTGLLVVPDAARDARFRDNPLVTGPPHLRFYAGVALETEAGDLLGALCVCDTVPRLLPSAQEEALAVLARQAVAQLELRRQATEVERKNVDLRAITDNVPQFIARVDADRRYVFANRAYDDQLGLPPGWAIGRTMAEVLGESAYETLRPYVDRVLAGEAVTFEPTLVYPRVGRRVKHVSYNPERGPDGRVTGFLLSAVDITERQDAEAALRERTELLDSVLATIPHQVFWKDNRSVYLGCNAVFARAAGLPAPPEIAGKRDTDLPWTPEEAESYRRDDQRVVDSGEAVYDLEETSRRADGSERVALTSKVPLHDAEGRPIGVLGVSQDITERKRVEQALREHTQLLTHILNMVPHHIFWKDRELVYQGCNANLARAAGFSAPAEVVGKTDYDMAWTREEAESFRRLDRQVMATGQAVTNREQVLHHADGTRVVGLTSKTPLWDAAGRIVGVIGAYHDITEIKALESERAALLEETERLLAEALDRADRDPLTGLLNHRAFHKRLEEATHEDARVAVLMLDLDNFKFFNDAYGHQAGDDVLRRIAEGLRHGPASSAVIARFGGDEFAVLAPGLTPEEAGGLADRVAADLGRLGYTPPGHDVAVPLKVSVGVAVFPDEAAPRRAVLDLADERLRLSKAGAGEASLASDRLRASLAGQVEGFPMLDALVAAVDNKDRYTRRHSEDVLEHSLAIARGLGMGERERHTVAVAALLHDVGKIGVPDYVLRKPGRLTEAEFEAVRQHPMMGAIIVQAVPGLEGTLDAVRHHHERWDGGGYPFGLRGEETPLVARLMAVADAYSAMTTDRPYRAGMAPDRARAILRAGAGTQWDPACVQAFLQDGTEAT